MQILEDIWFSGMPTNKHGKATNKQCRELCELIRRNEQELLPLVSDEAQKVFEKLKDNLDEFAQISECEIFTQGFKLGARIMLDVLDDSGGETLNN